MKIDDIETSQRLAEFIKENGGNVSKIARECNLTIGHLGDIVRGAKRVSLNVLKVLVDKKDLNPNWLFMGHGTMYLSGGNPKSNQGRMDRSSLEAIEEKNRLQTEITDLLRDKVHYLEQELGKKTYSDNGTQESRKQLAKYESKLKGLMKELEYSDEQILRFINDEISLKSLFNGSNQTREVKRLWKERKGT